MKAFKTFRTQDRELGLLQDNVRDFTQVFQDATIVDGVQIGPFTVNTVNTVIPHTLSRMPLGYVIVRKRGLGDIYDVSMNANNLTLISSVQVAVTLWVY